MDLITYALLNKKKASLVNGKVPASQLPSYVDEVLEFAGRDSFPTEGDKSKIYVDTTTGSSYRWGGTTYFTIDNSSYTKEEIDNRFKAIENQLNQKADLDDINGLLTNTKSNIGIVSLRDMNPVIRPLKVITAPNAIIQKYGRNLLPNDYQFTTTTINGITFTNNNDGTITANGTATDDIQYPFKSGLFPAAGKYAISGAPKDHASETTYYLYVTDGEDFLTQGSSDIWLECQKNAKYTIGIGIKKGYAVNNLVFKPQIEHGQRVSEYQQYKEPVIHQADTTGNIVSINSENDIITLISPDSNNITVSYYRDLNKAISDLQYYLSFETL